MLTLAALLTAGTVPVHAAARDSLPKIQIAPDGRTFQTSTGQPFRPMGVTYYRPGTGWAPQVWKQFDADATRADFARLKELGANCVRVFLSFGSFLTAPDELSAEGLAKFDQLLAAAEEAGLYVHPTGPDHWEGTPSWAAGDRIADDRVLDALETFWKRFAARYHGRNVIFAYDLRNEPEVGWDTPILRSKWNEWVARKYATPEALEQAWGEAGRGVRGGLVKIPGREDKPRDRQLLDYQHFREEIADEWTRRQVAAIKSVDPEALVTVGLIQWSVPSLLPGIAHYAGFRPERQARFLDFLEFHFYPFANGFYEYQNADDEEGNLAYLESVAREVARPGKPVVVAEFGWYGGGRLTLDGGKHAPASAEQQARWCRRLVEVTSPMAVGWLNWGFYDHPQAGDVSQLTGLLTVDDVVKPWGAEFRRLTARPFVLLPIGQWPSRPVLDWDLCLTSGTAQREFREKYKEAFEKQ